MVILIRREDVLHLELRTNVNRLYIITQHEEIILNTTQTSFVKDNRLTKIILAERLTVEIHYHHNTDLLAQEFEALRQGLLPEKS